jgi:uncharacterized protein (TIGR02444 family)
VSDFSPHPFWDFSLKVYSSPGVAPACLVLQDGSGADINVLLFCGWVGAAGGGRLDRTAIQSRLAQVVPWQTDVVQGLRTVRRTLKQGVGTIPIEMSEPLRKRLQALEIDTEHLQQLVLGNSVDMSKFKPASPLVRRVDVASNMVTYFSAAGLTLQPEGKEPLNLLIDACVRAIP